MHNPLTCNQLARGDAGAAETIRHHVHIVRCERRLANGQEIQPRLGRYHVRCAVRVVARAVRHGFAHLEEFRVQSKGGQLVQTFGVRASGQDRESVFKLQGFHRENIMEIWNFV